jgi:hypothetical protein
MTFTYDGITLQSGGLAGLLAGLFAPKKFRRQQWAQLRQQFAAQNHFTYQPVQQLTAIPAGLPQIGEQPRLTDAVSGTHDGHAFWAATYLCVNNNMEARLTLRIHAASVVTGARLPHVYFDASSSSAGQRSGRFFAADQLVHPPELDRFYKTYLPVAHHPSQQAIVTPEVTAVLMKLAGRYSVELVDGGLYFTAWNSPVASVAQLETEMETLFDLQEALEAAAQQSPQADVSGHLQQDDRFKALTS